MAAALLFDVLGHRSLGALMLSTLPIALISGACCLIGPWMSGERRLAAFRTWLAGAVLILIITAIFAALGSEQSKVGELIFTYACLLIALPGSLLMPVLMSWGEALPHGGLVT